MDEFDAYGSAAKALRAWAQWRQDSGGASVGYPKETPFRKLMLVEGESNLPALPISDEYAMRIDRAVSTLKTRSHPVPGDYRWMVIMDAYLGGYLDRQIANYRKLSRSTVRNARQAGENWIEGALLTSEVLTRN